MSSDSEIAEALLDFIGASPSPFHAVSTALRLLGEAGFTELLEADEWPAVPGSYVVSRAGALVAWTIRSEHTPTTPLRVIGAHTDSPNLRIKPRPDSGLGGFRQLAVEVYGAALLNSWLDRDLGLSGRVAVAEDDSVVHRLFLDNRPLVRVPQLAIHLDREISEKGLLLNKQSHLAPVWELGAPAEGEFRDYLAEQLLCQPEHILAWDVMCHDTQPGCLLGRSAAFVSAPRLDNLCSCFGAIRALTTSSRRPGEAARIPVVSLFDHEEVGSTSERGAAGPLLSRTLERIALTLGGSREDHHRAVSRSTCLSADMAHATHPNYADRHEPGHWISLGGGPVIKTDVNQRYATDSTGAGEFRLACGRAGVPVQEYVNRSDLPCGSTIGPLTAATSGMTVVDVGMPQLAMHSARELMGTVDVGHMLKAYEAWFR